MPLAVALMATVVVEEAAPMAMVPMAAVFVEVAAPIAMAPMAAAVVEEEAAPMPMVPMVPKVPILPMVPTLPILPTLIGPLLLGAATMLPPAPVLLGAALAATPPPWLPLMPGTIAPLLTAGAFAFMVTAVDEPATGVCGTMAPASGPPATAALVRAVADGAEVTGMCGCVGVGVG